MLLSLLAFASTALIASAEAQMAAPAPPAVADLWLTDGAVDRDRTYLLHAREADVYEIEASRMALQRSQSASVRSFARTMINHHQKNSRTLAGIAPKGPRSSPASLREPKSQMLDTLRSSTAADFDARYVTGQIAAHEEALALHRAYLASARPGPLRSFATRASALVEKHLATARSLAASR